jgi:hypothetical protein
MWTSRLGIVIACSSWSESWMRSRCSTSSAVPSANGSYATRIERKPGAVSTRPSGGLAWRAACTPSMKKFSVRSNSISPYSTRTPRSPAYRYVMLGLPSFASRREITADTVVLIRRRS